MEAAGANPARRSPGRWPTVEEVARSRLFSPIAVGRLTLPQRTWVPAMVPWRATEDGFASPNVIAWYERFARGRPGALVVEATGVRDIPSGPLLRIGDDRFLPGLREIVAAVKRASGGETRLFIQLIDFLSVRRRPDPGRLPERISAHHADASRSARAAGCAGGGGARTAGEPDAREACAKFFRHANTKR